MAQTEKANNKSRAPDRRKLKLTAVQNSGEGQCRRHRRFSHQESQHNKLHEYAALFIAASLTIESNTDYQQVGLQKPKRLFTIHTSDDENKPHRDRSSANNSHIQRRSLRHGRQVGEKIWRSNFSGREG